MQSLSSAPALRQAPQLRAIADSDAASCHVLSRAVGWPHRVEDWQMGIALGRGVVAVRDGEIVATALWWPYGEAHATLGMIIVSPDHQGGGIGKQLMDALFAQAQGRSLLLNATAAGEPLYAKLGFVGFGQVHQHHGNALGTEAPILQPGDRLRSATSEDLSVLERLDLQATGLPRQQTLRTLLACGEAVLLERGGASIGFSVLRRFGRGLVVGPVVAESSENARILIAHWLHEHRGQFLRVDVPSDTGLEEWLTAQGLKPAGPVTSMARGVRPVAAGPARLFALINQALG